MQQLLQYESFVRLSSVNNDDEMINDI